MASEGKELTHRINQLRTQGRSALDAIVAEGRPLTDEERAADDARSAEIAGLEDTLARYNAALEREKASAQAMPDPQGHSLDGALRRVDLAGGGAHVVPFRSLGEQLAAVALAAQNPHATHQGLLDIQAAGIGSQEGIPSEGGYLVQTDFTQELLELAHESGILYARTDRRPISANANGIKINAVDETSRVDGSRQGGIRAYWAGEGASLTSSRPTFRQMELNLQKLTGLYYATDEELKDTTALAANVARWFGDEFGFKLDDALFRGTGAGMPLGILGHAGTVSVAKETGQTAATILAVNVEKMVARLWARSMPRSEWYINQDCWPQLFQLSHEIGTGGVPMFIPPGGLSAAPFGALLGRPVMPIEHCATLGTVGDIVLADWMQYLTIEKGGVEAASSIHVQFLTDETVFRFILRADGQPKRNATLTPFQGTATQSSFVTLATRA
jgi:HK97 family phage major capsid protein